MRKDITLGIKNDDPRILGVNLVYMADGTIATFPLYRMNYVKSFHCARHARLAANEFFGRHYDKPAPAWDLRYIYPTVRVEDLDRQFEEGLLVPGDLVGVYNPTSDQNGKRDSHGNLRDYTHIVLFIGETKNNRLVFGEQYIRQRRVVSLRQLMARGNEPIEIIKDAISN